VDQSTPGYIKIFSDTLEYAMPFSDYDILMYCEDISDKVANLKS